MSDEIVGLVSSSELDSMTCHTLSTLVSTSARGDALDRGSRLMVPSGKDETAGFTPMPYKQEESVSISNGHVTFPG